MNERTKRGLLWVAAIAAALACLSAIDSEGFRRYLSLRKQIAALAEKNRQLADENQRLARDVEALRKDPRAIERAAREDLRFVKPGEIVFKLE